MNVRDPVLHHVAQPIVDRTGIDPVRWSLHAADGFIVSAVGLSLFRVATYGNVMFVTQAFHVIGALMLAWWMRWTARNGAITRVGPLGGMHVAMRWMLLLCLVIDVPSLVRVLGHAGQYRVGAPLRVILQAAVDGLGAGSLFLSACTRPPPRRRAAEAFA
jgi:hypothetical protein